MNCCCENIKCYSDAEKKEILDKIVKIEEKMFVEVKSAEPIDCQSMLKTFQAMRSMSFAPLSGATLHSYWEDLMFAVNEGRNLVMEKYARMDNLIPVINENPLIGKIVALESEWMKALNERYPHAIQYDNGFARYAHSELETYSDQTLELYYADLVKAQRAKINLVEARYLYLYSRMGFKSLEEVEEKAENRVGK